MIELYYWPTPNGHKITMFLEESGLAYRIVPVNLSAGEQFSPEFLAISPNNRMPAIVDHAPADAGPALPVFESGAILWYLANKSGQLLPTDLRGQTETLQWLFWQAAGLGPSVSQRLHFAQYAPERLPYAIDRFTRETERLYGVLDQRLADRPYIAGEHYTVADIAVYPWVVPQERQRQDLNAFVHVKRWFTAIAARPATVRAYACAPQFSAHRALS